MSTENATSRMCNEVAVPNESTRLRGPRESRSSDLQQDPSSRFDRNVLRWVDEQESCSLDAETELMSPEDEWRQREIWRQQEKGISSESEERGWVDKHFPVFKLVFKRMRKWFIETFNLMPSDPTWKRGFNVGKVPGEIAEESWEKNRTKKRPLNTNALWKELCPHCGSHVPRGYETCHACSKKFVWVRSGLPTTRNFYNGSVITFDGPCLPGQETAALQFLREKSDEMKGLQKEYRFWGISLCIAVLLATLLFAAF